MTNKFVHIAIDTQTRGVDQLQKRVDEFLKKTNCEIISAQTLAVGNIIHVMIFYNEFDED